MIPAEATEKLRMVAGGGSDWVGRHTIPITGHSYDTPHRLYTQQVIDYASEWMSRRHVTAVDLSKSQKLAQELILDVLCGNTGTSEYNLSRLDTAKAFEEAKASKAFVEKKHSTAFRSKGGLARKALKGAMLGGIIAGASVVADGSEYGDRFNNLGRNYRQTVETGDMGDQIFATLDVYFLVFELTQDKMTADYSLNALLLP